MATTIQISEETKQLLDVLKTRHQAPSYEVVLKILIEPNLKVPKSMYGKLPRVIKMTKADKKHISHEIRSPDR